MLNCRIVLPTQTTAFRLFAKPLNLRVAATLMAIGLFACSPILSSALAQQTPPASGTQEGKKPSILKQAFSSKGAADGANKEPSKKVPATAASAIKSLPPSSEQIPGQREAPVIVATVNGSTISRDELAALCLKRCGTDVLDSVLNKALILQACQAKQIIITQKDVDNEIEQVANKFNLSTPLYLKLIEEQRDIMPDQYMADVIWPMLALRRIAKESVEVSQADIDKAFQAEFGPKVQVRMIAMEDRAKAESIHSQAKADPNSFKLLAKQHSQDPTSASVEGLLPPIRRYGGNDTIENQAFKMKADEISDLFQVGNMWVCLQCVRHLSATMPSVEQIAGIHANIRREMEDVKLREMADTLFTSLREQASVVKVFGNQQLEQQYPGTAALLNNQPIPMKTLEDECIKRFGPKILDGAIHRKLLEGALEAAGKVIGKPDIDAEIARAAEYYGMIKADGSPDVEAWIAEILKEEGASYDLYISDVVWPSVALKKLIDGKVSVTDEDMQKGYEANYGPRAEILAIVCSNQRTAHEVWQLARDNPTEQFFGELAAQYSVEPSSRSNYGKVPPLRKHGGQPTLEQAAFKLQPGELSGIIESGGQYMILRSQGFSTPIATEFEAVKKELYKDLLEKKQRIAMEKHLNALLDAAQIDNFIAKKVQIGTAATQASLKTLKEQATSGPAQAQR
jgi:parvulin-like peptidyl-prolyl isomerase